MEPTDPQAPPTEAAPTPGPDVRDPGIWARVPKALFDEINELRTRWSDSLEGRPASMSLVVRALVMEGRPMMDHALRSRAEALRSARGWSMDVVWRHVLEAGLSLLEREVPDAPTPDAAAPPEEEGQAP